MKIKTMEKIELKEVGDVPDGRLLIAEKLPFKIKRAYFIDRLSPISLRGFHAHKKNRQAIFSIRGKFKLELYNGYVNDIFDVEGKSGYLIEPRIWHVMRNFSEDCLICVFASELYDENDYIRSYHDFKKMVFKK